MPYTQRQVLKMGSFNKDSQGYAYAYSKLGEGRSTKVRLGVGHEPQNSAILLNRYALAYLIEHLQHIESLMTDDPADKEDSLSFSEWE